MKKKFFLLTTVPISLRFFKGQIAAINNLYEVTLISSPDGSLEEIALEEKVYHKGIEMKRDISVFSDLYSFFKLLLYFYREAPHIIHCNTPKASLLGLIAGFIVRVPTRIYYIHGLRYEGATGLKQIMLKSMERLSCFCATHIVAVSEGVKTTAAADLTQKHISIIHNGSANGMMIDSFTESTYDLTSIKEELKLGKHDFVFGFVGRLVADKGINELVAAFARLSIKYPTAKLLLVGYYEDALDPLQQITKETIKNNPNILECGFQRDVKKYISVMDIFVSPSYREGFGLTLLEANLMGKPVIATRITGYSEIVVEGVNGFLINKKDVSQLQSRMDYVFNHREEIELMRENCLNIVRSKYNHDDVKKSAIKFYRQFSSS
ncbi:putative Capsular polysaccharide biosynthesis glycosyl transferase [Flavobacteriaceae bacterium 3519-10]|nr:putative Capsular polysaccharide biosynthesis glycosyl transferase [Flavobacteriaceae bacterium 3519-10]